MSAEVPPVSWWSRRMWGAHLIGALLLAAAVALGVWQWGAWQDHRAASRIDLTHDTPVPLDDVFGPDDPFPGDDVGRPVTINGTWVPTGTVFVSGRQHDGADGYWVVTPVAVGGEGEPAIPVVRGWVARPSDAPAAPTGDADVTGWLQPGEGTLVNDTDPSDDVLPQLRIADLIQHVDQDLYGGYAIATEPTAGLAAADLAQLPKTDSSAGLRNFLYAIEWWFFGGFAIFLWWKYIQELRNPEDDEDGGQGDDPEPENAPQDPAVASQP